MVNADDFGISAGVNRGILEAHAAGVVSSVSVLVTTPGWEDAVRRLRDLGEGGGGGGGGSLGVGLHLNLTVGQPISDVPTLREGRGARFRSLPALVVRALAGRISRADVARECAAQLARLRETGVVVTHIDSHRHVHVLPGVWTAVTETAGASGVSVVRVPLEPAGGGGGGEVPNWCGLAKGAALWAAWAVAARGNAQTRHADHFYGLSLQGSRQFRDGVLALLDRLETGTTELMVHPGYPDAVLAAWDGYVEARAAELAALTSSPVRERFRRGDFRLTHFGEL